jgi:signal transduction histidine kinase
LHADDVALIYGRDAEEPIDELVRYRHKDGSTVWVRCRSLAIRDRAGKPIRLLGAHTDVTDLKRTAEALLERDRELLRANQEIEELAHAISHDLSAPARAVRNFGRLLGEELGDSLGGEVAAYLDFVTDGAERLQGMVSALLAVARLEGAGDPRVEVDLNRTFSQVELSLGDRIEERGARVEAGELPTVRGRKVQLFRVLSNLVDNSLKFSTEDPSIAIEARDGGATWEIEVRDNGIGIADQQHQRIFEIFQRLHTAEEYPGYGVGLAICKKIAHLHGGDLTVASTPGEGSCFTLHLPK